MTGGELFSVAERYLSDPVVRTAVRSSRPQPRGRAAQQPRSPVSGRAPASRPPVPQEGQASPHGHRVSRLVL